MVCLGCMACTQLMEFRLVGSPLCCQCFLFSSACQGREGKRIFCVLINAVLLVVSFRVGVSWPFLRFLSNQAGIVGYGFVSFESWKEFIIVIFGFFSEYPEIFIPFFWENWLYIFIVITWLLNSALRSFLWTIYLEMNHILTRSITSSVWLLRKPRKITLDPLEMIRSFSTRSCGCSRPVVPDNEDIIFFLK